MPPPLCQVLIYPAVDLGWTLASYGPNTGGISITGATMVYFLDQYAPDAAGREDWRLSPLRAPSHVGRSE